MANGRDRSARSFLFFTSEFLIVVICTLLAPNGVRFTFISDIRSMEAIGVVEADAKAAAAAAIAFVSLAIVLLVFVLVAVTMAAFALPLFCDVDVDGSDNEI